MVSKNTIPKADDVVNLKLLAHQKHKPAETVKLGIQSQLSQVTVQLWVNTIKQVIELFHFSIYARVFSVHSANKAVSDFRNNNVEAEKEV